MPVAMLLFRMLCSGFSACLLCYRLIPSKRNLGKITCLLPVEARQTVFFEARSTCAAQHGPPAVKSQSQK